MKPIQMKFMREAITEAAKSRDEGGIPIGAVVVKDGIIVGRGHNQRIQKMNPLLHAEIECLTQAFKIYDYSDINNSTLYTTLMPCFMCAGAIIQYGISTVISADAETFPHAQRLLESNGITVVSLNLDESKQILREFILKHREYWISTSMYNTHVLESDRVGEH